MGSIALRDAFHEVVKDHGMRCVKARLYYCDASGHLIGKRDHQIMEFDLVNSSNNTSSTLKSPPMRMDVQVVPAAVALAKTLLPPMTSGASDHLREGDVPDNEVQ